MPEKGQDGTGVYNLSRSVPLSRQNLNHHKDCDFWTDQYEFECVCGLTMPRPEWSTFEPNAPAEFPPPPAAPENSQ
jgi:hypothetical protein